MRRSEGSAERSTAALVHRRHQADDDQEDAPLHRRQMEAELQSYPTLRVQLSMTEVCRS